MTSSQEIKDNVRKAYDDIAPHYAEWTKPSYPTRLSLLNRLLPHLTPKEHADILELGCGAGIPCTKLLASHQNFNVTGNDISRAQIDLATKNLPSSVKLIESDMMSLEFENGQFDAVVAMFAIIHLPREEQRVLFERILHWLKPGGWFLANFAASEIVELTEPGWLGGTEGMMYWSGWGAGKTCEILKELGFELSVEEMVSEGEGEREVPFLWVLAKKESGE